MVLKKSPVFVVGDPSLASLRQKCHAFLYIQLLLNLHGTFFPLESDYHAGHSRYSLSFFFRL